MKKTFLLLMLLGFGIFAIAQSNYTLKPGIRTAKAVNKMAVGYEPSNMSIYPKAVNQQLSTPEFKNTDFVNVIDIGTAANAYSYGYGGGQKTIIWADDALKTITNVHRMGGALDPNGYSGDLGYDISTDAGLSWSNMNEIYLALENSGGQWFADAARYPNHAIYNPPGNTDPNNAYMTFFVPTTRETNGTTWGGYAYGRARIGDNTDTTRHIEDSRPADDVMLYIPDGFTITRLGDAWVTDINQDWSTGTVVYLGQVYVRHGIWDEVEEDYFYDELFFDLSTIDDSRPTNTKVAFAPDGMTGWICALADNGEVSISQNRSYFPILWKTDDAGETWSDPISVALAGDEGIGGVQNFLSDEELAELFEAPIPDRDEIEFTTAFDFDLHVDAFGNPHIAVIVGITGSTPYTIITERSVVTDYIFTAAVDITSFDGGDSWVAHEMGRLKTFRGEFGTDFTEDNRIQIASSWDGTKMFVTWLDTDLPGVLDNNQPDIWCRGLDVSVNTLTTVNGENSPYNVTEFSEGMWQAYFQCTSHYVFTNDNGWTIPITYEDIDPSDPLIPVQYKYITDFSVPLDEFLYFSVEDVASGMSGFEVSQNHPNPATSETSFNISLDQSQNISVEVFNITGQKVFEIPTKSFTAGIHPVTLDVSALTSGIYFYKITAGDESVSHKMIVE